MNSQYQEKQEHQDNERVKKDLGTLISNRIGHLTEGFEKITGDAKETVVDATESVKKDVGQRLVQYNDKVQEVVEKVPGGFVEKTIKYPWVALSLAVIAGMVIGGILKPRRVIHDRLG
jgi:ElaB/YqjD/DUF883 family membrane-anchored ribosome-binding protein